MGKTGCTFQNHETGECQWSKRCEGQFMPGDKEMHKIDMCTLYSTLGVEGFMMKKASTTMTKTVSMPGGWPSCVIVFNEDKVPTQFQLKKLEGAMGESAEVTFVLKADVAIELFKKALKAAGSMPAYF
ncbi:hypothetical protein KKH23_08980 [Patescibacteria group bacterium]|nr:hypothetical protein [Patescibacteria group bacterium]